MEVPDKSLDEQALLVDEMIAHLERNEPDSARVISTRLFLRERDAR